MAKAKTRAKAKGKKRPAKVKQTFLPEMEPPNVAALDEATEQYVDVRDTRMEWTKKEIAAQQALLVLMKEHGLENYETPDGLIVVMQHDTVDKIKVKRRKEPSENGDGE